VSAAAASVLAAIVLWQSDNPLAFLLGLLATAVLVVAPVITVGLWADVRHQKRPGRQSQSRRRERSRRRRPA
jgi:NhaP-type Na+/H+ or K+/H+ antiporter